MIAQNPSMSMSAPVPDRVIVSFAADAPDAQVSNRNHVTGHLQADMATPIANFDRPGHLSTDGTATAPRE
ncbi:hypothetical protein Acy02nite_87990 [Actinoplanes cyaneus]|uniref:Uncharacterized protein n=1 Tax=Actinoplanes cyaneus TaxID=52696 RepID=A0A919IW87_9ACTN|nr:hypothetical protein Acy02nite_87990 [Actinoplanes cyaneus]